MDIPVLIAVFNRADLFEKLLSKIRVVKPSRLYVSCDGPRNDDDRVQILKIKEILNTQLDWDVQLFTNFREINMKSFRALPDGISWFFEHEEMGIILEDDCIPEISFFPFCEELLHKYATDERVFSISGNNFQDGNVYGNGSYFFSRYFHVWGWASWRRAWKHFDINLTEYPAFKASEKIYQIFDDRKACDRIIQILDRAYDGKNVWDYKWQFAHLNYDGYTIKPQVNLVTNIGFDERATHIDTNARLQNLKTFPIEYLIHPSEGFPYYPEADSYLAKEILQPPSIKILLSKLLKVIVAKGKRYIKYLNSI